MSQIPKEWILILAGFVLLMGAFFTLNRMTGVSGGGGSVADIPANAPGYAAQNEAELPTFAGGTPTPDGGSGVAAEGGPFYHIVQPGETLQSIANEYEMTLDQLVQANNIANPDIVAAGKNLIIPERGSVTVTNGLASPNTKLIPDSELVFGPSAKGFDISLVVPENSYLRGYSDTIEGSTLNGIAVVQLVAERTRVHPRLLLAALEHRAGWVTQSNPIITSDTMMGNDIGGRGLYRQLEWAANRLNLGYYGRSEGGLTTIQLADGTQVAFDPTINDGTAGVQTWLGSTSGYDRWISETSRDGFFATYNSLFGDPFAYTDEGFWPPQGQPNLELPWDRSETWYFTGGPHGGWIAGSGWAALDFVPPDDRLGCYEATVKTRAVADGVVTRSDFGAVVLDLDGDGYTGTGWAILYQHVATRERVTVGTELKVGDPLGYPSCEGGFSSGTHLHIARMYNGRWVAADGDMPFNLDGWVSQGSGSEYNGSLVRNGVFRQATIGRIEGNSISAE